MVYNGADKQEEKTVLQHESGPRPFRLGIDIGGTTVKLGLVDRNHHLAARASVRTPLDFSEAVGAIAEAAGRLLKGAGQSLSALPFAGLGVPSTLDQETGRIIFANNAGWKDAPLREAMRERLGIPVLFANDADCALAGEALAGAAAGAKDVLMFTLGTGVGGAMLMDGRLYRGANGMGMELGHIPLVAGGRACTCGVKGCLEAYVSATGLVALTREAMDKTPGSLMHSYAEEHAGQVDGRTAFDCAQAGDGAAEKVVQEYCELLAQGIGGQVNVFRPERVVIGGGLSHAGRALLERLKALLPRFILSFGAIPAPELCLAQLGNDAGVIGAASLDRMQRRKQRPDK